jgi:hypothetical protein
MVTDDQPPLGKRFSLTYRPEPQIHSDSERFRNRVFAYVIGRESNKSILCDIIPKELGLEIKFQGTGIDWKSTFRNLSIIDFLDTITLLANRLTPPAEKSLVSNIGRIVQEEGIALRIDTRGGFHPLIDPAFEAERIELISGLNRAEFTAAEKAFREAHNALSTGHEDTLSATRGVIDAVENVFKVVTGKNRIGSREIMSALPTMLPEAYGERADNAAKRLIASFAEWANGAHQYRHADNQSEPTPPPREIAVQFMSAGAGWIRWLISLHNNTAAK